MREFINNNVNAPWKSNIVSKQDIEQAINDESRVYVNYTTDQKGEHERVFVPTSVMYSSTKNRYRVVGVDLNKTQKGGRVAFIVDKITDWQNLDSAHNNDNNNDNDDSTRYF